MDQMDFEQALDFFAFISFAFGVLIVLLGIIAFKLVRRRRIVIVTLNGLVQIVGRDSSSNHDCWIVKGKPVFESDLVGGYSGDIVKMIELPNGPERTWLVWPTEQWLDAFKEVKGYDWTPNERARLRAGEYDLHELEDVKRW